MINITGFVLILMHPDKYGSVSKHASDSLGFLHFQAMWTPPVFRDIPILSNPRMAYCLFSLMPYVTMSMSNRLGCGEIATFASKRCAKIAGVAGMIRISLSEYPNLARLKGGSRSISLVTSCGCRNWRNWQLILLELNKGLQLCKTVWYFHMWLLDIIILNDVKFQNCLSKSSRMEPSRNYHFASTKC